MILGHVVRGVIREEYGKSKTTLPSIEYSYVSSIKDRVKSEYTKGAFDGNTYINEWADIKLVVSSNYYEEDGSTYKNSNTDCGLFLISEDVSQSIVILYEKLPLKTIDEERYLNILMNNLDSTDMDGIIYQTTRDYTNSVVGGYTYNSAEVNLIGERSAVQTYLVRKIDDRMIVIILTGLSSQETYDLAKTITNVD